MRCPHCGATTGVIPTVEYVGGHGYQAVIQCADRAACWARWDEQHGLAPVQQKAA